jgi:hypothetical protein
MRAIRDHYGAGPLHLLATVASFAIAGYAFLEVVDRPAPVSFALWFGGAIIAHDLIAFPIYSGLALIAGRTGRAPGEGAGRGLNYVRVPAVLSAFAFIVWFPLILGLDSANFEASSGLSTDGFLERWLALTAALFVGSGVVYAVSRRARGRGRATDPRRARAQR